MVGVKFTYVVGTVEICEANTYVLQIHIWRYVQIRVYVFDARTTKANEHTVTWFDLAMCIH